MSSSLGQFRPSAAEAMNSTYTKNNTSMKFTMQKQSLSPFEQLRYLRKNLVGASLGHFVRRIGSSLTGLDDRENIWYSGFGKSMVQKDRILLRFYIDFNKMHNHGLTLENLAQEVFGRDCQWNVSPDFMGMIDISVPPDTYYISQWLSRTKNRVCGTSYVLSCDLLEKQHSLRHTLHYSHSDNSDTNSYTKCMSCMSNAGTRTRSVILPQRGRIVENTPDFTSQSSFFTRGTDVLAACKVPGIDKSTLKLNNVTSVEKHFGIEAAANILAELTGNVIISDFMARTGRVLPFSKHSSEVSSKGLLTSMGFERPKDDIQREITGRASTRSRVNVESVYEHIITGKDPPSSFRILT